MLSKRIIACLDVKDGKVVKGVRFKEHKVLGDILDFAHYYCDQGADELVFYDIGASPDGRCVSRDWISRVAEIVDIPFCVAGGIRSVADAKMILNAGADKVSINSPAIERPELIHELAGAFGSQCVVLGIDSLRVHGQWRTYRNTGDPEKMKQSDRSTLEWVVQGQELGAGEIVLNCMDVDGVGQGYDLLQLQTVRSMCHVPLVASGGAGLMVHFERVFLDSGVDAALAAGVFHRKEILIPVLKTFLKSKGLEVRL